MKTYALMLLCACGPVTQNVREFPAPEVACETDNGILFMAPLPKIDTPYGSWDCRSIQRVEDTVFKAFSRLPSYDERFKNSMQRTRGYRVYVVDAETVAEGVVGLTYCDSQTIYISNALPHRGALGHELAHAVQGCTPAPPYDLSGDIQTFYHSNWGPIYKALMDVGLVP